MRGHRRRGGDPGEGEPRLPRTAQRGRLPPEEPGERCVSWLKEGRWLTTRHKKPAVNFPATATSAIIRRDFNALDSPDRTQYRSTFAGTCGSAIREAAIVASHIVSVLTAGRPIRSLMAAGPAGGGQADRAGVQVTAPEVGGGATLRPLGRCRRLAKDDEETATGSEAFVKRAMIHLIAHRLARKVKW